MRVRSSLLARLRQATTISLSAVSLSAASLLIGTLSLSRELDAQVRRPILTPPKPVVPPASPTPTKPTPAAPATTPAAAAQPSARVIGVVFDSTAMRPLAGALVQLVASDDPSRVRSSTSDARGAYALDSVRAGSYLLGFFHAKLDSLGIEAPLLRVDVRTDGEIRAPVAIPSGRTLVARLCGPSAAAEGQGMFMGFVRSSRAEGLSAPARIRAQWKSVTLGPRGVERRSPALYATTSASGAFSICGIPTDGTFMARAFVGADSSGFVELEAPRNGFLFRDVYVGSATKVPAPVVDDPEAKPGTLSSSGATVLRGNGKLRGIVRNANGQPVQGARLVVWGSGVEATTGASGQFAMQTLPAGTYTLESRALGYMPRRTAVDVLDGTEGSAEIALDAFVPTVDTVRIKANRGQGLDQLADFEKRRKSAFGHFIDEDALSRRNPTYMSDVFRTTPGMTIMPGQSFGDQVLMRGSGGSGTCIPAIFLNNMRVMNDDGNLDNLVNPQEVRAVEIYSRTASVPIQFQATNGCGSIVIWTGGRRPPADRR